MAYNGSGVFQRLYNFVTDRNNGVKIRADRMDGELDGFATGLSNAITKDGQTTVTANIPFNDKRLTGVGDASSDADAVNRRSADARYVRLNGSGTMTGPIFASDGTVSAPGVSFGSDTNSGFYRIGSDNIGAAVNGAKVLDIGTGGIGVTGTLSASAGVSGTTGTFSAAVSGTTGTFTGAISMQSRAVDAFPSGTRILFQQSTAPTGWTKDTTHDDKAIRIVSGTVGTGGTTAFSTVFAARPILQANLPNVTLSGSTNSSGSHTHDFAMRSQSSGASHTGIPIPSMSDSGSSSGSDGTTRADGNHSHTVTVSLGGSGTAMNFSVNYVDVVICQKD